MLVTVANVSAQKILGHRHYFLVARKITWISKSPRLDFIFIEAILYIVEAASIIQICSFEACEQK